MNSLLLNTSAKILAVLNSPEGSCHSLKDQILKLSPKIEKQEVNKVIN